MMMNELKKNHKRKWSIGLDRSFSEEELAQFLSAVDNDRYALAFQLMAYLGLRRSEAVRVNLADIDLKNKTIKINNVKCRRLEFVNLHKKACDVLDEFIRRHEKEIKEHDGYLIYSQHVSRGRKHICEGFLATIFRGYMKKAGLTDYYALLDNEGGQHGKNRRLYRLSTHSLRHYFITKIYRNTKDPLVTQKLARHSSFSSTQSYISLHKEDEINGLKTAFEGGLRPERAPEPERPKQKEFRPAPVASSDCADFREFMELYKTYKMWREANGK